VEALAEAARAVPNVRAVILGEGDGLEPARELAQQLGVADRIEFSGRYLPMEEALSRVADADCGVIPNRPSLLNRFALSNKLFEYVALDVPVVVSGLETLAKHFGPDEVTFFEAGNAASLAEAISWVAGHPDEVRNRVVRARARAAAYSWQENRERYLSILSEQQVAVSA
jgi:glycosyltransferase involved in cell wall biosynthesis